MLIADYHSLGGAASARFPNPRVTGVNCGSLSIEIIICLPPKTYQHQLAPEVFGRLNDVSFTYTSKNI
jgi:hypothetical protein